MNAVEIGLLIGVIIGLFFGFLYGRIYELQRRIDKDQDETLRILEEHKNL